MTSRKRTRSLRDLALYVAVAVGLFALLFLLAFHQVRAGHEPGLPVKWLGFMAMTALVFVDTIRTTRRHWGSRRFWLLLGVFFVVQSSVGGLVLSRVSSVPLIVYVLPTPLNYIVLSAYLDFFSNSQGN